jgi:CheY-like chemotaxis protein
VTLAYESLPADHPVREDLQEAQKAADRASTLTRQLLTFARKQVLDQRMLNLNDLIRDTDKLLRRLIGEDIEVETRLAPNLALIQADPGQIQQVLINLAVNARDAMPHGGWLTIETSNADQGEFGGHTRAGRYVRLAVRDTGVGIAPEVQARMFEPFFTTKTPGNGTGLGLATCYGILEQHGGSISAESVVGQGASFTIYLPAAGESQIERPVLRQAVELPRGSETVLLVEDEDAVRTFVAQVLRSLGYTVLEADNGAEALRRIAAQPNLAIDLLLTDIVMPQLGGEHLAAELIAARPRLKVIYMSGYTDNPIVRADLLPDGFAFLAKPFTPTALAHKLRAMLDV